ncbi:MAG: hypothetical protein EXR44_07855 [Dehalococcoidia bacterium]|nr:hypothetical protein [Dehalococcoidia bacterium]
MLARSGPRSCRHKRARGAARGNSDQHPICDGSNAAARRGHGELRASGNSDDCARPGAHFHGRAISNSGPGPDGHRSAAHGCSDGDAHRKSEPDDLEPHSL